MSDIFNLTKNSQQNSDSEKNVSNTRNNRVNFSLQSIKVNKNEIIYSSLSNQIKHIFVYFLKRCHDKHIMKQIFYRWQDNNQIPSHPQQIILRNQDATQLIWRMQKIILNYKMVENSNYLKSELQELQNQRDSYLNSFKEMQQKQNQINLIELRTMKIKQPRGLIEKIIKHRDWVAQKLQLINEQIQNKKQNLKSIENALQLSKDSTAKIRNHLTKIIIKEVRTLLKQTIIGILQISNKIIKQGQVDTQQVYIIFEQSYRTIKIKKTTIVLYLGSDFYFEKVSYFRALLKARILTDEVALRSENIFCCHLCMKICKLQQIKFCTTPIGEAQTKPYPCTDYLYYRKNYLEGDFFYEPSESHIIPFHHYNTNRKDKLICNRGFCEECVQNFQGNKTFSCPYCLGFCACSRCEKAVAIVKLMALDYQNDPHGMKPYHELLKLFGGKLHKDISQVLRLRQPYEYQQFQLAKQILWDFNKTYCKIQPAINPKRQVNFNFTHLKKVQQNKICLNLFETGKQSVQQGPKQEKGKTSVLTSAIPKNDDDYLNQLFEPLFYKNYSYKKYARKLDENCLIEQK